MNSNGPDTLYPFTPYDLRLIGTHVHGSRGCTSRTQPGDVVVSGLDGGLLGGAINEVVVNE